MGRFTSGGSNGLTPLFSTPEEVARELFSPLHHADARARVESLVAEDPRFLWDETGSLRTADATALSLEDAPFVVFDVETTGSSVKEGAITEIGALKVVRGRVVMWDGALADPSLGEPVQFEETLRA